MQWVSGLTLLEVIVTISIVTIVTYFATTAFPVVREEEALLHARQIVTSTLRSAQIQALNEQRSPDCLAVVGTEPEAAKLCSDIGILLHGQKILTFADTNDNDRFDEQDFHLRTDSLPVPIAGEDEVSLLIEATPPNVTLWHNGEIVPPGQTAQVSLVGRKRSVTLAISSYGVVESSTN